MDWKIGPDMEVIIDAVMPVITSRSIDIVSYMQWHDCGKPYCLEIDQDGRRHYPNHAALSASIWTSIGGDPIIGTYIARDMDFHLLRHTEAEAYASKHPDWMIMLISALCETHANAAMFGGMTSESFKIKMSRLNKIAKRMCSVCVSNHLESSI